MVPTIAFMPRFHRPLHRRGHLPNGSPRLYTPVELAQETREERMSVMVRKLGDALGAEITGVDVTKPIDADAFSVVNQAFLDHSVLGIGRASCRERVCQYG